MVLELVKEKISNNAKNKLYDKENKEVLVEFRDTIINDIESVLADAQAAKVMTDKVLSDDIHSDEFVVNKLTNEIQYLESSIEKLNQMNTKSPKLFRLMDIYKAYKRIMKTNRSIRNIKEYLFRVKEDRVIHAFKTNSQYD